MKKRYVFYYDLLKIIAAFMVCFYHLAMLDVGVVTDEFYIPNVNKICLNLCAMSVPLFFMVNGALHRGLIYGSGSILLMFQNKSQTG